MSLPCIWGLLSVSSDGQMTHCTQGSVVVSWPVEADCTDLSGLLSKEICLPGDLVSNLTKIQRMSLSRDADKMFVKQITAVVKVAQLG